MKKHYDFSDAPRGVLYGKIKTVRGTPHVSEELPAETITVNLTSDEAQAVKLIVEEMSLDDLATLANLSDEDAQHLLTQARSAVNKINAV